MYSVTGFKFKCLVVSSLEYEQYKRSRYITTVKSRIRETLTLLTCADNSNVSKKINKKFGSNLELLPVLKALCRDDLEGNAGIIHATYPENLPVLRLHAGTILNRTPGRSTRPIKNTSFFLGLYQGPIWKRTRGRSKVQSGTPPGL